MRFRYFDNIIELCFIVTMAKYKFYFCVVVVVVF